MADLWYLNNMEYRLKRHITNTLLYAVIITGIGAIIRQYSKSGAIVFFVISIIALAMDRIVENNHLKKEGEVQRE